MGSRGEWATFGNRSPSNVTARVHESKGAELAAEGGVEGAAGDRPTPVLTFSADLDSEKHMTMPLSAFPGDRHIQARPLFPFSLPTPTFPTTSRSTMSLTLIT